MTIYAITGYGAKHLLVEVRCFAPLTRYLWSEDGENEEDEASCCDSACTVAPATRAINNVLLRTTSPCKPSGRPRGCISCGQLCLRSTASRGSRQFDPLWIRCQWVSGPSKGHTHRRSLRCRYYNRLACTAFHTAWWEFSTPATLACTLR